RSRAPRRSGGRRTPRRSDRSRAPRRSGGRRTPRRSDRHDSGLRVNWHDRWHWVRHWIVWLDSGHRVTRLQVIWLDSGHRVIWQGSVLRVNWYDRGALGQTLDHLAGQRASGHQASGHLAQQRAP
ncbi:unnamed protein product, partial [Staurois parvus]